ncbi:hypothetical protein EPUL_006213 [Erysiphe pulchra]|uniref:CN hydrolase domain-containing protein n=1 Tax=Erysiphe pulchra TaxID=225359 RepID=A0A2S4PN80_9PEZI|nr:hypothetical protein EPUL_006213 [Erysiphe pulchra]
MKIAVLQFMPLKGNIKGSIAKVEKLIQRLRPGDVDLLVLPELAFAGYNFPSLEAIKPYLEHAQVGPTSIWAKQTAQRLRSIVTVGYAETTFKKSAGDDQSPPEIMDRKMNFNSNIAYGPDGTMIAHYRKHFLYIVDESWCVEGRDRFYAGNYPAPVNKRVAMGICMDINPYRFEAPWNEMEFARHALQSRAELIVLSMAWTCQDITIEEISNDSRKIQPDLETLRYWTNRFEPIVMAKKSVLMVFGNRCGYEEDVVYTGTSTIARAGYGKFEAWDIAGVGEERLIIADTNTNPQFS